MGEFRIQSSVEYASNESTTRSGFLKSRAVGVVVLLFLLLSMGLWLHSSGLYYRPLGPLGMSAFSPQMRLDLYSYENAAHARVEWGHPPGNWGVRVNADAYHLRHYRDAWGVSILGLGASVLPTQFVGSDYFIEPYVYVTMPWWLIASALALLMAWWFWRRKRGLSAMVLLRRLPRKRA